MGPNGLPYLAQSDQLCQERGDQVCVPGVVEFLEVPGVLVDLEILLGEEVTKGADRLLGDCFKRTEVHDGVSVLGGEVCAWGNGVEACSDISGGGINEFLDLSLGVRGGGAHLII